MTADNSRRTLEGVALMLLGIVGVSTSSLWVRLSDDSAGELAFRRMLFVLPAIVVWARMARVPIFPRGATLLPTAVSAVLLGIHFWAWNASLERLPVATSLLLVNVHPVMVFLVEWGTRRVAPTPRAFVGVAAAIVGMALLAIPPEGVASEDVHKSGVALAIVGAVAIAGYLIVGRELRSSLAVPSYLFVVYGGAALFLGACLPFGDLLARDAPAVATWFPRSGAEWGIALLLALLPTLLGHTPMNAALRRLPATVVSTAFLGEVVVASFLVWIVRGETLPECFWPGAILVVGGIALVIYGVRPSAVEGEANTDSGA